jgi:GT2 family glycosyltransferase
MICQFSLEFRYLFLRGDFLNQPPLQSVFIHIVVLGYGKFAATTQLCLDSLALQLQRPEVKVTVIDNGSPDEAAQLQETYLQQYPQIQSVILPNNLGYAGGMNYGVNLLESDWVFLLGSDTILAPNTLENLYRELKEINSTIGIVGPLTNEAGTAQRLNLEGLSPESMFVEFQGRFPELTGLKTPIYRADFFAVAIRKSLWHRLNGLDMSYGRGYYEDFDFCMRAKALGFQSVMLEDLFVYHAGSMSFKSDPLQKQLIKKNKKIFINKFPSALLLHRREDNVRVIKHYLDIPKDLFMRPGIQTRLSHRLTVAQKDEPRSFWKKWLWRKKVAALKTRIKLKQSVS